MSSANSTSDVRALVTDLRRRTEHIADPNVHVQINFTKEQLDAILDAAMRDPARALSEVQNVAEKLTEVQRGVLAEELVREFPEPPGDDVSRWVRVLDHTLRRLLPQRPHGTVDNYPEPIRHLNMLPLVLDNDREQIVAKEQQYQGSWKARGGVGAFMMLARKWDRLEPHLRNLSRPYDLFFAIRSDERPEGVMDDVRDLRRYLALVESEAVIQGWAHLDG